METNSSEFVWYFFLCIFILQNPLGSLILEINSSVPVSKMITSKVTLLLGSRLRPNEHQVWLISCWVSSCVNVVCVSDKLDMSEKRKPSEDLTVPIRDLYVSLCCFSNLKQEKSF